MDSFYKVQLLKLRNCLCKEDSSRYAMMLFSDPPPEPFGRGKRVLLATSTYIDGAGDFVNTRYYGILLRRLGYEVDVLVVSGDDNVKKTLSFYEEFSRRPDDLRPISKSERDKFLYRFSGEVKVVPGEVKVVPHFTPSDIDKFIEFSKQVLAGVDEYLDDTLEQFTKSLRYLKLLLSDDDYYSTAYYWTGEQTSSFAGTTIEDKQTLSETLGKNYHGVVTFQISDFDHTRVLKIKELQFFFQCDSFSSGPLNEGFPTFEFPPPKEEESGFSVVYFNIVGKYYDGEVDRMQLSIFLVLLGFFALYNSGKVSVKLSSNHIPVAELKELLTYKKFGTLVEEKESGVTLRLTNDDVQCEVTIVLRRFLPEEEFVKLVASADSEIPVVMTGDTSYMQAVGLGKKVIPQFLSHKSYGNLTAGLSQSSAENLEKLEPLVKYTIGHWEDVSEEKDELFSKHYLVALNDALEEQRTLFGSMKNSLEKNFRKAAWEVLEGG